MARAQAARGAVVPVAVVVVPVAVVVAAEAVAPAEAVVAVPAAAVVAVPAAAGGPVDKDFGVNAREGRGVAVRRPQFTSVAATVPSEHGSNV